MKYLYAMALLCVISSITVYAEPSVYGNSNSFTSSQKIIYQNEQILEKLQRQVIQQNEQIEGLKSIVEGLSEAIHQLNQTSSKSIADNSSIQDLAKKIDRINDEYVTKDELKSTLGIKNTDISSIKKPLTQKTTADIYTEGVRLFVKQRYDEAKKKFIITDTKGYKIAASNYYLGEISYYTKQYEDAIFYFKKSASMNDKTSYIDTLLLHTAISLEHQGKSDQAKAFYENIIANYDGKKTASIAREKLKQF